LTRAKRFQIGASQKSLIWKAFLIHRDVGDRRKNTCSKECVDGLEAVIEITGNILRNHLYRYIYANTCEQGISSGT
jgi:hypothetical protein